MKKLTGLIAVFAAFLLLTSCSHRLTGTWNVVHYKTMKPDEPGVTLSNIGNITFNNNGKGEKNISYTLFTNLVEDKEPFSWKVTEDYVAIESNESDFSRIWIITTNKPKSQIWKTTDGKSEVKILELKKEK